MVLTNDQIKELSAIFERLFQEYNDQLHNKDEIIAIKVLELLIQIDRYFTDAESRQSTDSYSEMIDSFNDLIQLHF
jgi:AraC family transcriptional activator of pobA